MTAVNGVASFNGLSLVDPGSYSIEVKSGSAATATIGPDQRDRPDGNIPGQPSRHGPVCSGRVCTGRAQ